MLSSVAFAGDDEVLSEHKGPKRLLPQHIGVITDVREHFRGLDRPFVVKPPQAYSFEKMPRDPVARAPIQDTFLQYATAAALLGFLFALATRNFGLAVICFLPLYYELTCAILASLDRCAVPA